MAKGYNRIQARKAYGSMRVIAGKLTFGEMTEMNQRFRMSDKDFMVISRILDKYIRKF